MLLQTTDALESVLAIYDAQAEYQPAKRSTTSSTPVAGEFDAERDSLEHLRNWKENQPIGRYGAGTPAPTIPNSQRAYDGDNWHDYCEVWVG